MGRIVHWEVMGPQGDELTGFYKGLFGWNLQSTPGFEGYNMVDAEETGIGGAVGQGPEQMPNYLTFYVEVDSIDEHLANVEAGGGSTVDAADRDPGHGDLRSVLRPGRQRGRPRRSGDSACRVVLHSGPDRHRGGVRPRRGVRHQPRSSRT